MQRSSFNPEPETALTFGEALRRLRRRAGLTQRELGLAVGYSEAHIARLESNQRTPDPASIRERFLAALGLEKSAEAQQLVTLAQIAHMRVRARLGRAKESDEGEMGDAAEAAPPTNLPPPLTPFVGRQTDIEAVRQLLRESRLITITGSGGVGKTRLAAQVAMAALPDYPHGAWVVELATVTDPLLVVDAVAAALGLRPTGEETFNVLLDFLRNRHLLLILDGCDRMIWQVADLSVSLLRQCPRLQILITSREVMGVVGETVYRLEGLLPEEAVQLFISRAHAARPDFSLKPGDEALITDICRQLDGLPLAVELAASRVRGLTLHQIAERLTNRFQLLAGGVRATLPHHQALRALIDWSYDLLSDAERVLLRRLAVFVGGWTLEAAEAVCCDDYADAPAEATRAGQLPADRILELLIQLVNKSLVLDDGSGRYRLTETLRQYAQERLEEAGERDRLLDRHMRFYFALSEQIMPFLGTAQQRTWLLRFEQEIDNFRAALGRIAEGHGNNLLEHQWNGLHAFWSRRGYWAEGVRWLNLLAEHTPSPSLRAEAMFGAAHLLWRMGEYERMHTLMQVGSDIARRLGEARLIVMFQMLAGIDAERYEKAREALEQGLRVAQQAGLKAETAGLLLWLGKRTRVQTGDLEEGTRLYEEGLAIAREVGDRYREIGCIGELGLVAFERGEYSKARAAIEQCVAFMREMGDRTGLADWLMPLSMIAFYQGELSTVRALVREGIQLRQRFGSGEHLPHFLMLAGSLAHFSGDPALAVRLLSKASRLRESLTLHNQLEPLRYRELHQRLAAARATLEKTAVNEVVGKHRRNVLGVKFRLALGVVTSRAAPGPTAMSDSKLSPSRIPAVGFTTCTSKAPDCASQYGLLT